MCRFDGITKDPVARDLCRGGCECGVFFILLLPVSLIVLTRYASSLPPQITIGNVEVDRGRTAEGRGNDGDHLEATTDGAGRRVARLFYGKLDEPGTTTTTAVQHVGGQQTRQGELDTCCK